MSNVYPSWWNTRITVFNRYEDKQTNIVTWHKTHIDGAFWKYTGDKVNIGNTILETNNTICRIRENEKFLERYQWEELPNDQMDEYFTLSPNDIIVKGTVMDEIDEYVSGRRSGDVIAKYKKLQGCMEIQEVAINVGGGRNNPHYYVKGV